MGLQGITWDEYKQLSKAKREEYMFKFGEVHFDVPFSPTLLIWWYGSLMLLILLWYFYYQVEGLKNVQFMIAAMQVSYICVWVVVADMVAWCIAAGYNRYRRRKWLREALR